MNGKGMRVHVIFDVPEAENLDAAMARLGLVKGETLPGSVEYTPPAGVRIFSYSGIKYNIIGSTSAVGQMATKTVKLGDTGG